MSTAMFQLVYDSTILQCLNGGQFQVDTGTTVKNTGEGHAILLEGGSFKAGSTPCSKSPPNFPAPCQSFLPATTMEIGKVMMEGKRPVTTLSVQISAQNMIPAFTYLQPSVKVKVN